MSGYRFLLTICLLFFLQTFVKSNTIEGRVIESSTGEPLIGANIIIMENNWGAASDRNGYFRIERLPSGIYTLRVQYVGYSTVTQTITLSETDDFIKIVMEERTLEIDEIIVTASPLGSPVGYQPAQSLSGE